MKLQYYPDTDSLYIDLSAEPSTDSVEISKNIVMDIDREGRVVGIDIQHASLHMDLSRVETGCLPLPLSA